MEGIGEYITFDGKDMPEGQPEAIGEDCAKTTSIATKQVAEKYVRKEVWINLTRQGYSQP